ncbi:MAG: hypothetical protein IKB01_05980 [Lachnospiraceae bacterium]|nr:hypothetical protein [Lachnospiraceae bacterium]
MKENKWLYYTSRGCVVILAVFMCTSILTFVVQNILCERMHIDNAFVRMVIGDDKADEISNNWSQINYSYINWEELYPFEDVEEVVVENTAPVSPISRYKELYLTIWNYLKTGADEYTGSLHMFYDEMVSAGEAYNRLISWDYLSSQSGADLKIFTMKDGTLGYVTDEVSQEDMNEIVDSVVDFDDYLNEQGIPFLYVNAGSKMCEEDYQVPAYISEYVLQNQDLFLKGLEEKGIDYIDIREELHTDGINHASAYYVTDPHWRFETALWAAEKIAIKANENYGFQFDLAYFDEANYIMEKYENAFMGAQGLSLHLPSSKKEDFVTVYPKDNATYHINVPTRNLDITGDYMEAFVVEESLEVSVRMYDSWNIRNEALIEIDNLEAKDNRDKKVLILYDSFSWPMMTYLATDVAEIDAIHLCNFNGSIREYVAQTKPNLVLMVYSARNIVPINWNTHTSTFDLR